MSEDLTPRTDVPQGDRESRVQRSGVGRGAVVLALVVGLGVGLGGAYLALRGGDDSAGDRTPVETATSTRDGDPEALAELPPVDDVIEVSAATDPEAALRGFLAAESVGEWEASYEFLTDAAKVAFPSPAAWVNHHADIPTVIGYRIDEVTVDEVEGTASVQTLTGYESVLDPTIGLVPARSRRTWQLQQHGDGTWRVEVGVIDEVPLFPGSAGAEEAVRQWVDARVACEDTEALEAGLIGSPSLAQGLCDEEQAESVEIGPVGSLVDSSDTTTLVSEFGSEVFVWARSARVEAATPFVAVLGPIDNEWRVVAVLAAR